MMNDMCGISDVVITPFQGFLLWRCHFAGLCPALVYYALSGQKKRRLFSVAGVRICHRQPAYTFQSVWLPTNKGNWYWQSVEKDSNR